MDSHNKSFTIIEGGKAALEREKVRLFKSPQNFTHQEFDNLCDALKLELYDVENLIIRRLRANSKPSLEKKALLAILENNPTEARRLRQVLQNRNERGLSVVS